MIGLLISVLTFLAVFLGIFTVNLVFTDLFKKDRQRELDQLEAQLRLQYKQRAKQESATDYGQLSQIADESRADQHFSFVKLWNQVDQVVSQSGLRTSTKQLTSLSIVFSVATLAISILWIQNAYIASALAGLAAPLPFVFVSLKRRERLNRLTNQLPDALDLISRILRAGQTVNQGLLVVSEEFRSPVSEEFGYCYEQQNLGIPADVALRQLAHRTGVMEIRIFVMGVLIHRQTGGNLAQLLDKLANIIRQRVQMKQTINSLTAEGRLQASILIGLPFVMWFLIFLLNPNYALKLMDHPWLIAVTISFMGLGAIWIRKIVVFDF